MIYIQPDKSSLKELIPIFGLYGVVIIRLIPLFTQINQNVQIIRLSNNQINEIIKNVNRQNKDKIEKNELAKNSSNYKEEIKNINRIEIKNLSFSYDGTNYVLKNLNLEFTKDKTFYLEGKNGSGKSTLVDLISGMLKPTQGKIEINGEDIRDSKLSIKSKVGYVSQTAFLINDSIKENIIFGRKNIEDKQVENVIKLTGLDKLINNLPDKIDTNVGNLGGKLSGGQKQKIMIARSLIDNPGLIILDESTNALDFDSEKNFLKIIDKIKKNKIIIFISHSEQIKKFCDEKYLLQDKTVKKLFLK